jgi:hypothetical protein
MKNYYIQITLCLFLFFSFYDSYAQKQSINDYIGTWRWVSGNKDTLIILLKPLKESYYTQSRPLLSSLQSQIVGFHTYIEKGEMVESNMNLISDTITNFVSISGQLIEGTLRISFRDFTRDTHFKGSIQLLKEIPGKAFLSLPFEDEKIIWERKRIFPAGRTIPNNIVLEKIN